MKNKTSAARGGKKPAQVLGSDCQASPAWPDGKNEGVAPFSKIPARELRKGDLVCLPTSGVVEVKAVELLAASVEFVFVKVGAKMRHKGALGIGELVKVSRKAPAASAKYVWAGPYRPYVTDDGGSGLEMATYEHLSCGCRVIGNGTIPHPLTVKHCPLHAQASVLLELAERVDAANSEFADLEAFARSILAPIRAAGPAVAAPPAALPAGDLGADVVDFIRRMAVNALPGSSGAARDEAGKLFARILARRRSPQIVPLNHAVDVTPLELFRQLDRLGFSQHGAGGYSLPLGAGLELWCDDGEGGHPGASCVLYIEIAATGDQLFFERMGAKRAARRLSNLVVGNL